MTAYFLAVDGGSQSAKVSVIDAVGTVHASGQAALQPYELGPDGRAVHPGDDLWDTLAEASRQALASFAGDPGDIVAVGLCGIRFCRAMVDASGHLTEPVLSWMDARVSLPVTGLDPEVATLASAGGYLTIRLTGNRRDSAASYLGMWPIDPETRQWSTEPAEAERTGMPLELLPDLVDPGELLGLVSAEASEQTNIPAGVPVYATANDKAVEALGCGLVDPGTVLLSLGTYIASMTVGDELTCENDGYWVNAAAIPGRHLYESGGIRRGMWTVTWLTNLVSGAELAPVDQSAARDWLNAGARAVPPGCGGLMTIPDWLAPGHAPHRRGAIIGLDGSHGAHHLYRSVLEGIALSMRVHTETMESALGRSPRRMLASGGGSQSDLMMQILTDVFGRPVERAGVSDAAGLGSAICAAVGSGTYATFEDALEAMVRGGQVFEPDPEAQRQYERILDVYSGLTEFTDPMFERTAVLGR